MGFRNPIVGGTTLVRQAIKSGNYSAGSQGWVVRYDGSAEFNNLTVRGEYEGMNYEQNADGIFFYTGTPALGNMAGSWASAAGTDQYGNSYPEGLQLYSAIGNVFLGGGDGVIQSIGASGSMITVEDGQVSFQNPGDYSNAFIIEYPDGSLYVQSAASSISAVQALFRVVTAPGAATPGDQDTYPRTIVESVGGPIAHHYVTGSVVKATAAGLAVRKQAPTMGPGWATGPGGSGSYPPLKWWYDAEDNVRIFGTFHATSTAAGVIATGLPPVNQTTLGGVGVAGNAQRFMGSGGDLALYLNNAGELRNAESGLTYAVGDTFMVNATIPLGNLT